MDLEVLGEDLLNVLLKRLVCLVAERYVVVIGHYNLQVYDATLCFGLGVMRSGVWCGHGVIGIVLLFSNHWFGKESGADILSTKT